ncbi:Fic family protein [Caviibacterium pharyngocola]|uniref:Uncharacterized protein n=1 Tax=Caviibacterium pharyngocola TaxID=28159 RepID=A0A2M8RX84_9PAST|nr:RNA-binding domain-containing protein [Caviibacterium pharyngocola]PJG83501.1 hypothetical protein CVP04_03795 [Caviibacterium pharyngocola]
MDISTASLKHLLSLGESSQVEFKLALGREGKGELPKDFWRSYSAMANAYGGWIILGIKEKNNTFSVAGISDIDKLQRELFSLLNNRDHISANLISDTDVVTHIIEDKKVLAIKIKQASRKEKPVFLTKNPFGNTYIRLYDGDRLCSDEQVKRMLSEQLNDSLDNEILSPHFSFTEDIEHSTLNTYRNRLSAHKPDHPFLDFEPFEFFKKIGGWRKDRFSGKEGITLAGLLMFGKFEAIQDHFPHYFIDYRELSENRWDERIFPDGTWSGNLFDFYRKVYQKLVSEIKIPFNLQGDQRIDETPVHEALREALVNTLVHANYAEKTPVLIEKSGSSFRFRNPGILRITRDEFFSGGVHDCRNSLLHQMFLLIGLGERAGSGVPKILKGCDIAHWRKPILEEKLDQPQYTTLIFEPSIKDTQLNYSQSDSVSESSRDQAGTKSGPSRDQAGTKSGLSSSQININSELLALLQQIEDELSIQELMNLVGRTNRTKFRKQYIQPLMELGLLEMTIPNKPTSSKQRYRKTNK